MNVIKSNEIADIPLVFCINHYIGKYRIRYNIKEATNEVHEEFQNENISNLQQYSYSELDITLGFKPRLGDVQQAILNDINTKTDKFILSGFVWKDMNIWLSTENQFNYKAAYDLAIQTNGATLPVVFKFGTAENPVYYEFKDLDTITDFYTKAMFYINTTLKEGWELKDSIDWSIYENELKTMK